MIYWWMNCEGLKQGDCLKKMFEQQLLRHNVQGEAEVVSACGSD